MPFWSLGGVSAATSDHALVMLLLMRDDQGVHLSESVLQYRIDSLQDMKLTNLSGWYRTYPVDKTPVKLS